MENNQDKKNDVLRIKETILLWWKHWYYFVISFAVCGILGIVYLKTATPGWGIWATVSLRYDNVLGGSMLSRASSLMSSFGLGSSISENIEDETLKMQSQGYIKDVIKNLDLNKEYKVPTFLGLLSRNLYDRSPIIVNAEPLFADTVSVVFSFQLDVRDDKTVITGKAKKADIGEFEATSFPVTIQTDWGNFTFEKTPLYDQFKTPFKLIVKFTSYDYMAQEYIKELSVSYEKRTSDVIHVGLVHEDIPFAKRIVNEVIKTYNEKWGNDKDIVSQKTLLYIDNRLVETKQLLQEADKKIQQFKDMNELITFEANVTYYFENTAHLQAELLEVETQLKITDIIVEFVSDSQNKYALIPFDITLTDKNMANMIGEYNLQLMRRNELYKENITQSILMRSLDERIEVQRKNLLISVDNIKKGLQITRDNIKNKENEFAVKTGKIPVIEKEYAVLIREQTLQQTVYKLLLEMREQTAIAGISILPKLNVITPPYSLNKKVSPRLIYVAFVVFMLGMAIPLSLIYVKPFIKSLKKFQQTEL